MKIILQINGREQSFSEAELIEKLQKLERLEEIAKKRAQKPTEGKWFDVNVATIDTTLFIKKREDAAQEATRQLIQEAFREFKSESKKYSPTFKTMIPEKTWSSKTVNGLKEIASQDGNHIANWVEQAMEWAQRISNGESWEELCNKLDTANWYRLVIWKRGYAKVIGGASLYCNEYSATDVDARNYSNFEVLCNTVPLIVLCNQ